jgi:PPOX class probable FMN-dependent enzyme
MNDPDPHVIKTVEELRSFYQMPNPLALKAKLAFIDDHMAHYIRLAPFVCLATESNEGLDASPRGGEPGFVQVLDRNTVGFGDWPGNNKLESFSNILETGRCSLLLMVPRLDTFLRINGTAVITRDPVLCERFKEGSKLPKTVVKLRVKDTYFHCGKAFRRSHLWSPEQWPDVSGFPTVGKVLTDILKLAELDPEQLETRNQESLRNELY